MALSSQFPLLVSKAGLFDRLVSWTDHGHVALVDGTTDADRDTIMAIALQCQTDSSAIRDSLAAQIAKLEATNPITPRALREFMLITAGLLKVPLTTSGLARAKAVDDEIAALRAQIPPL
jgi:hypothetical protein